MSDNEQLEIEDKGADTPQFEKTQEQWDALVAGKEDLKVSRDKVKTEMSDLKARLGKFEQADIEANAAKEQKELESHEKKGQWDEIYKHKDGKLAKVTEELNAARAELAQINKLKQRTRLVDAVAAKAPDANRTLLDGLMRVVAEQGDIDLAPESFDGEFVDALLDKVKAVEPRLFEPPAHNPPPVAGGGQYTNHTDASAIEEIVKKMHNGAPQGPGGKRW